jgi:hypothetical protein
VEVPLEGDEGVAGGGGDVLGVDFGFLGDAEFVVQGADGFEGVGLVVGLVAVDGLEGEVGVDVSLKVLRGHAVLECVRHEFSVKGRVSDRGAMALNITYDYAYRASVKLVVSCRMFVRARQIRV